MNPLRKLIELRPKINKNSQNTDNDLIGYGQTYYDLGQNDCRKAFGSKQVFRACLAKVFQEFKERCRVNENEQERLSAPYKEKKSTLETELQKREVMLSLKEEAIENNIQQIVKLQSNISNVKANPENFGLDDVNKSPMVKFYIGLLVLLPITLYLIVFYMSASYSAFFKEFDTTQWTAAIFDAQALSKAYKDGWLEVVFVSTIPFAFMGLGYLIHMFQREKGLGKLKIALLFIVTFIFDAILAYQIDKKIYDIGKSILDPNFDLNYAFTSAQFWGIIFAGFVVYVIWGLVFDFVMEEYEEFDKINVYIRKWREEIANLKEDNKSTVEKINAIKTDIAGIKSDILSLQAKIDGFIFNVKKYKLFHTEYVKGWYMVVAEEIQLSADRKDKLLSECEEIEKEHLHDNQIGESDDFEHIIYSTKI